MAGSILLAATLLTALAGLLILLAGPILLAAALLAALAGLLVLLARVIRLSATPQVTVRGDAPDWTASLIANRLGNAERLAAFSSLVNDLRAEYHLKAG